MSSSVCQGFQSWLELRHIEQRSLRLKLAPPKTNFSPSSIAPPTELKHVPYTEVKDDIDDFKSIGYQNVDTSGWSFLQSLTNVDDSDSKRYDNVYVHPLVKRPVSMLSERSLEMCTESLGNETGSEANESIELLSLENVVYNSKPRETSARKKPNGVYSFPPPLTSISGSSGVKVKSQREGGRLVLQAMTIPPRNSYFHTERSEGRLRLSLFKDADATRIFEDDDNEDEDREEVVEKNDGDEEVKHEERLMKKAKTWKEIECVGVEIRNRGEENERRHKGLFRWQPLLMG